jgi:predicted GNAT family N-acyltransferase
LREDDAWTLTVVLTWNGLQALLELFEKQTRDKHGGVFEPIHAWPALAGQSEEKDAIRKSLSELSKQYIGASLLIKAEHHDLGFYGKKGFERESTRIGDFIPAGPLPLFPQGLPFIPAGLSLYSRRAGPLFPQG